MGNVGTSVGLSLDRWHSSKSAREGPYECVERFVKNFPKSGQLRAVAFITSFA